jgi:hypothetical protein
MPEFWLSIVAGLHVPAIPLVDVFGRAGTLLPAQIVNAVPKLNVGIILEATVTAKVTDGAQAPAEGVNV